jgi:hypothetical protein
VEDLDIVKDSLQISLCSLQMLLCLVFVSLSIDKESTIAMVGVLSKQRTHHFRPSIARVPSADWSMI